MRTASTEVLEAIQSGDIDSLRALAREHGAAAVWTEGDPDELTSLHLAAAAGHEAVVRFLVSEEIGADVNVLRVNNFSPLHAAAMNGHAGVCELLLGCGADVNVQTVPQGYCPLHSAAWAGHLEAVQVLLRHGARSDLLNYRGEKPSQTALRHGHEAVSQQIEPLERQREARAEHRPWWKFW
jgi:cytohesin